MTSLLRVDRRLQQHERVALEFLRGRVLRAPPVQIHQTSLDNWIVFTDGSCEGEVTKEGGPGAILINPAGFPVEFVSDVVPQFLMSRLLEFSSHPIFEIELFPILCSLLLWGKFMRGEHVVFYTDNEAARGALIKGSTDSVFGQFFIDEFVNEELVCQLRVWFARVPTSNPADKPSRKVIDELVGKGAKRVDFPFEELLEKIKQV